MSRSRLLALLFLSVVLAAVAFAPSAGAEQLAYQCESDLCLIDPDNPADHKDITNTAGSNEAFPQWSPLGNLLAYLGYYAQPGNETWEIYTIDPTEADPEATNVSQTSDREENGEFDWSSDGTRIAFSAHPDSSANPLKDEAYVGRADGAALPVAIGSSSADEVFPRFSADGSTVAFLRGTTVYTAPADGTGTPTPLGVPGTFWSPDGAHMAGFRYGTYPYGLVISNADGSGRHELEKPVDNSTSMDWSCDSTRVTFVADEEPNPLDQVWVAPVDGSGIGVQIPMPPGWIVPHNPTFSPDGTRIAFNARQETGPGYEQLLVAPADGSAAAAPITSSAMNNQDPSWKPGPGCGGGASSSGGGSGGTGTGSGSGGSGAGGAGSGGAGGTIPVTQAPVKLKLSLFNHPVIVGQFMTAAGIDCNAQGGHPTGKVAEICAASGNAYATGVVPRTASRRARPKSAGLLFAKGSVKVPAGKTRKLKLKITLAGRKLLKPGRTLTLKLKLVTRQGSSKPKVKTVTVKAKVAGRK